MMKNSILTFCLCALMVSCASLGKYNPQTDVSSSLYGNVELSDTTSNIANFKWQEVFTDKQLQRCINEALESNKDLLAADEQIKQAEAVLLGAKLAFVPTLGITPEFTSTFRGQNPTAQTYSYNISASSSWQLDIFRMANNVKSAKASVAQTEDYRTAIRCKLIADVANTYYNLLMLDEQLQTAEKMNVSWEKSVETVKYMKEAGLADQVAVSQYEANLDKIRISVVNIRTNIALYENAMCLLLGKEPGQEITRGKLNEQTVPEKIALGVPVQMLTLRPDVMAAQREMELAFYSRKGAILNYFPTLTLNGSAGLANPLTGEISPMGLLANVGAGLAAPVLNSGKNRSNLLAAESRQREARINFDKTLLNAGKEVNDALWGYTSSNEMAISYESEVASLAKALEDTEYLMKNSLDKTYLDVLFANTNYLDAKLSLIQNQTSRLQSIVTLYSALGGGSIE